MDILTTSGLGKDYGALKAVLGLDLAVREGEVFGFLGPNGAGKTTSISMMTGVVTPSRGRRTASVLWGTKRAPALSWRSRRRGTSSAVGAVMTPV